MGHIELAAPVVHIWIFKAASSRLATLLGMKASSLEKVVYFQDYVVIEPGSTNLHVGDTVDEKRKRDIFEQEGADCGLVLDMGAEAIRKLLRKLDVVQTFGGFGGACGLRGLGGLAAAGAEQQRAHEKQDDAKLFSHSFLPSFKNCSV